MKKIINDITVLDILDEITDVVLKMDPSDDKDSILQKIDDLRKIVRKSAAAPIGDMVSIPICADFTPEMLRNPGGESFRQGSDYHPKF